VEGPRPGSTPYIGVVAAVLVVFVVGFKAALTLGTIITGADDVPGPPPAHPPLILLLGGPLFLLGIVALVSLAVMVAWRAVQRADPLRRSPR
jgi:hypothetical protein